MCTLLIYEASQWWHWEIKLIREKWIAVFGIKLMEVFSQDLIYF